MHKACSTLTQISYHLICLDKINLTRSQPKTMWLGSGRTGFPYPHPTNRACGSARHERSGPGLLTHVISTWSWTRLFACERGFIPRILPSLLGSISIQKLFFLAAMDLDLSAPHSLGTTIIGVTYDGGVVLGADSRTSTGPIEPRKKLGEIFVF